MSMGIAKTVEPSRRAFAGVLAGALVVMAGPGAAQSANAAGAQRIVVLDAGIAGYAFALEAPVVAADPRFPDARINRRTGFPPLWNRQAMARKAVALPAGPDGVDLAAIRAAEPDLIIAGGRNPGGLASAGRAADLTAIAPTLVVPADLPGWREELAFVADMLGRTDKVPALIAAFEARAAQVAGRIALPEGEMALLQANAGGIHEDPYAISAASGLGRTLAGLGFRLFDAASRVQGGTPDVDGRVPVPLAAVLEVFTAPNLIMVSNGPVSMGQLCCDPGFRQLEAVISYRRWELDESAIRPDYLAALRLLDMVESAFARKG